MMVEGWPRRVRAAADPGPLVGGRPSSRRTAGRFGDQAPAYVNRQQNLTHRGTVLVCPADQAGQEECAVICHAEGYRLEVPVRHLKVLMAPGGEHLPCHFIRGHRGDRSRFWTSWNPGALSCSERAP